jgi:hypothetical protein
MRVDIDQGVTVGDGEDVGSKEMMGSCQAKRRLSWWTWKKECGPYNVVTLHTCKLTTRAGSLGV